VLRFLALAVTTAAAFGWLFVVSAAGCCSSMADDWCWWLVAVSVACAITWAIGSRQGRANILSDGPSCSGLLHTRIDWAASRHSEQLTQSMCTHGTRMVRAKRLSGCSNLHRHRAERMYWAAWLNQKQTVVVMATWR